jgi:hypothetical protein
VNGELYYGSKLNNTLRAFALLPQLPAYPTMFRMKMERKPT